MTIDVQYLTPGGSHSQYQGAPCEPSTENLPPSGQQQQGGTKTDNPTPKSTSAAVKTGSATAQLRPLISTPSSTFQLQEDYPILLPLPLGPLFPVLLRLSGL